METIKFEDLNKVEKELLEKAEEASQSAQNDDGDIIVGAALLCEESKIYQGANINRSSVNDPTCAEEMVLNRAIFDNCSILELLAVIGFSKKGKLENIISPCGSCRQMLLEANRDKNQGKPLKIILSNSDKTKIVRTNTEEMLPLAYDGSEIK